MLSALLHLMDNYAHFQLLFNALLFICGAVLSAVCFEATCIDFLTDLPL